MDFFPNLEILLNEDNEKSAPFRKWRNKQIAHRDLNTAMFKDNFLGKITIEMIEKAHKPIGDLLNQIYLNLDDSETFWRINSSHDAKTLIHYLKLGVIYSDEIEN